MSMQNRTKLKLLVVLALVAVGAGWFATRHGAKEGENVPIRVLDSSTPTPFELALKLTGKDPLQEEKVQLKQIPGIQGGGGTVALQALLANNVDSAGSAWPAWINIVAKGGKIKALLGTIVATKSNQPGNSGLLVLQESGIHAIKDLAGRKIAVNVLGAEADYVIRQYLKKNGLSIDQVQLVVVPMENQEQMLRSRQVDAVAWTSNGGTYFDMAVENGGVREIPGTRNFDVKGENELYAVGFRDDFIKKHPDTVRRYVRAYDTARRTLYSEFLKDPERVRKAYADISKEKGGNPRLAKYFQATSWSPDFPLIADKDIQWWIDRFTENGVLKPGEVKASDVYTNTFNPYYKL